MVILGLSESVKFPFLFGRAFIEAQRRAHHATSGPRIFLPFLEGLSLRRQSRLRVEPWVDIFPFLLGGAFIEASKMRRASSSVSARFPFPIWRTFIKVFLLHSTGWVVLRFLAKTFIEAWTTSRSGRTVTPDFPTFS